MNALVGATNKEDEDGSEDDSVLSRRLFYSCAALSLAYFVSLWKQMVVP